MEALERNGFIVEADTSGDSPVGLRIKLMSLPLSKEVTFEIRDLEELIHLLADSPTSGHLSSNFGSSTNQSAQNVRYESLSVEYHDR